MVRPMTHAWLGPYGRSIPPHPEGEPFRSITSRECPGGHGYQLMACPICDADWFAAKGYPPPTEDEQHRIGQRRGCRTIPRAAVPAQQSDAERPEEGRVTMDNSGIEGSYSTLLWLTFRRYRREVSR